MLLSIKPRHVQAILNGSKRVELRRVRPRVRTQQIVAFYASSPTKAVLGVGRLSMIESGTPSAIKTRHLAESAISSEEFDTYFTSAGCATALGIEEAFELKTHISLAQLRNAAGTEPAQSWRYLPWTVFRDHLISEEDAPRLTNLL